MYQDNDLMREEIIDDDFEEEETVHVIEPLEQEALDVM